MDREHGEIYTMTTPIQSLVQTIAEYVHNPGPYHTEDVAQWGTNGELRIQYGVGPDDNHAVREFRVLPLTEDQAKAIEQLVLDAYQAGLDAGYELGRKPR
jgi:hypothetical protein